MSADDKPAILDEASIAKDVLVAWYGLILRAPEEWRRRATASAGLLSAAAAALLAGLLVGSSPDLQPVVRWVSTTAAVSYFLAVASFLVAATKPPVRTKYDQVQKEMVTTKERQSLQHVPIANVPGLLFQEANLQAKPVRIAVSFGKWSAIAAIALTVLSAVVLLNSQTVGQIAIHSAALRNGIERYCPTYREGMTVTISSLGPPDIVFTIPANHCGGRELRVAVPATDAMVSLRP